MQPLLVLLTLCPLASSPPQQTDGNAGAAVGNLAPLADAERRFLAGRPDDTIELLDGQDADDPRVLRLLVDAHIALGHETLGKTLAARLAEHPGWQAHAWTAAARLSEESSRRGRARLGVTLYALAFGVLLLGGGRELLRPRIGAAVFAVAVASCFALSTGAAPLTARVVALVGMASFAAVHAGQSAVYRLYPSPKGRLFIASLVVLAVLGAMLAVLSAVPRGAWLS